MSRPKATERRERYARLAEAADVARREYVARYRECRAFVATLSDEQFDDCAAYALARLAAAHPTADHFVDADKMVTTENP